MSSLELPHPAELAAFAGPVVRDGRIHRVCPLDLRPLEPVPVSTEEQVREAVARARAAQRTWRSFGLEERIARMEAAARRMLDDRDTFLALVREEIGKLEVEALFSEAIGPLDVVKGWSKVVQGAVHRSVRLNPLSFPWKRAEVDLVPRGVVGVLAPWNYPMGGVFRSVIPALLTGNGVVIKPSEYSPRSGAWMPRHLADLLPEGLVGVVHGDGDVGQLLIGADVDAIAFTGSVPSGSAVRERCAELGIPCTAEMGGNDAAIVLRDCDLERTIAGITHWALHNVGQACGAVELAYVEESIADAFVARIAEAWRALRLGPGEAGEVEISPMGNPRQLQIVAQHVSDALTKGAELVCGGRPTGTGLWFQPTILDRCTGDMAVVREETFGPVLAVIRVPCGEDAISLVNRNRYGLGASVWTADRNRARRIADALDVGVVNINNHSLTGAIPDLPWSGTRDTGFGIANSDLSLTTFARPRTLLIDQASDPEPFWMPFDRSLLELAALLCEAQLGRLGGAWKLPALMWRRVKHLRSFFGDE